MEILIKRLDEQAKLPVYGSQAGPGIDIFALGEVTIGSGEKKVVSTGIVLAVPVGYIAYTWNQKSVSTKQEIKVTTEGIDSGYREEVRVELSNIGSEPKTIMAGERIAQLLVHKIHQVTLIEAEDLGEVV